MNTIESILNDIDELLEDSWSLPLSGGRCVVDAEKVRDLIDSIRMNMPAEIKLHAPWWPTATRSFLWPRERRKH